MKQQPSLVLLAQHARLFHLDHHYLVQRARSGDNSVASVVSVSVVSASVVSASVGGAGACSECSVEDLGMAATLSEQLQLGLCVENIDV